MIPAAVSRPTFIAAAMSGCSRRCSWATASTLAASTAKARVWSSVVTTAVRHHSKALTSSGSSGAPAAACQQLLDLVARHRRRVAGLAALDERHEQRTELAVDERVAVGDVLADVGEGLAHRPLQRVVGDRLGGAHGPQRPQPAVDLGDVVEVSGHLIGELHDEVRQLLAADRLAGRVGRPHREPAPRPVGRRRRRAAGGCSGRSTTA